MRSGRELGVGYRRADQRYGWLLPRQTCGRQGINLWTAEALGGSLDQPAGLFPDGLTIEQREVRAKHLVEFGDGLEASVCHASCHAATWRSHQNRATPARPPTTFVSKPTPTDPWAWI